MDAELVEPAAGAPAGSKLIGVPEHSGRFWVNYLFDADVLKGWSVGAGIYAASGAPVDLANQFATGDYFTVDAKIAYENQHMKAAVHVKNLTGEDYFVPYSFFGGRVAPGDDRAVFGSLAYKF
ncbi:MAG: TonB-dependent receptor [Rhodospirillales bacterium]|nr:TonB-dependent receptor [Rhodospirillales bacterium]